MDLWDVVRLMLRRWAVAVPMLILTVAGTVWVARTVEPDYTAEGNISLIPPSVEEGAVAGKSRTVNPWDTDSLTAAVAVRLRSKALHDSLGSSGYSDVFEADRDIQFPSVVTIKVTAPTEQQASATARRLLQIVDEEVRRQQAQYKLKKGEEITTTIIDDGSNVQTATGKVKRALIVVFGIGAILTMIVTVCVDVFLRWRARRRLAKNEVAAQAMKLPSLPANGSSADATRAGAVPVGDREPAKPAPAPPAPRPVPDSAIVTQPVRLKAAPRPTATDTSPEATQRIPSQTEPVAEDATIVLPLSNAPWAGKKAKRAEGNGAEVTKS